MLKRKGPEEQICTIPPFTVWLEMSGKLWHSQAIAQFDGHDKRDGVSVNDTSFPGFETFRLVSLELEHKRSISRDILAFTDGFATSQYAPARIENSAAS
jgi:hypothetical protein